MVRENSSCLSIRGPERSDRDAVAFRGGEVERP